MPDVPGWVDDEALNTCVLGDTFLPGVCTLKGLNVAQDIDIKKAKGTTGATSEDNGPEPAEFDIEVHLATEAQYVLWRQIYPTINPRRQGAFSQPMALGHPDANEVGIDKVRVKAIRPGEASARRGRIYLIRVVEYFPAPKPVTKKKTTVRASPGKIYTEDPQKLAYHMASLGGTSPVPSDSATVLDNYFGTPSD